MKHTLFSMLLLACSDPSVQPSTKSTVDTDHNTDHNTGTDTDTAADTPITGAWVRDVQQFGITWTFAKKAFVGQYANGDYWVVGPVDIVDIDPESTNIAGRVRHGSMRNPSPTSGTTQGYESTLYGSYGPSYSDALNVALDVSSTAPLTISSGSVVSTISVEEEGARPGIETAAILTVVTEAPVDGSFRPAYCGTDKASPFHISEMDTAALASMALVDTAPTMAEVESTFLRPWIDHVPGWMGRYAHPQSNMPDYGREIAHDVGVAALMLNSDLPLADKETLLIRFLQLGIDLKGIVDDGGEGAWYHNGGHASGRKFPILFAGRLFNDADYLATAGNPDINFGESDQVFAVAETTPGVINHGHGGYDADDIGLPEWGIRHRYEPDADDESWGASYRACCTATVWSGFLLATLAMDLKAEWNHDVQFDYQDRYVATEKTYTFWDAFTADMWAAHRASHGAVWTE